MHFALILIVVSYNSVLLGVAGASSADVLFEGDVKAPIQFAVNAVD